LSFKPDTDDVSESPAIKVVNRLLDYGAIVKVYDPMAMGNAREVLEPGPNVIYCDGPKSAVRGSQCVVVLTDWEQFREEELYRGKVVVDGRRILNPIRMKKICKRYEGLFW
jgi:UDPglucose 6-dehydrogenase